MSIHSVREACAYVPQDNFLFSDTIAHNIGFGVDDENQEDIERAAAWPMCGTISWTSRTATRPFWASAA